MLQSETPSLHKTKTAKSEPKQSLIMADLKPGLACYLYFWLKYKGVLPWKYKLTCLI